MRGRRIREVGSCRTICRGVREGTRAGTDRDTVGIPDLMEKCGGIELYVPERSGGGRTVKVARRGVRPGVAAYT
jgi:hypothetical protein